MTIAVYVAGPYTSDPVSHTSAALDAGNLLLDLGYAPFVPLLSHFWERLHTPRHYEDWMRIDLAWVTRADAVLRLPGMSPGADREVAAALAAGVPVFFSTEELESYFKAAQDAAKPRRSED